MSLTSPDPPRRSLLPARAAVRRRGVHVGGNATTELGRAMEKEVVVKVRRRPVAAAVQDAFADFPT